MAPGGSGKVLQGKWAVATGASSGIGKAIAVALAGEGANIAIIARNKEALKKVAQECKEKGAAEVDTFAVDLSDHDSVVDLGKKLQSKYEKVDVLVNAAGMWTDKETPLDGDVAAWEKELAVNLHCPMILTRMIAPGMADRHTDGTTKWGLRGWSLSSYEALCKKGVKVQLINPGVVNTALISDDFAKQVGGRDKMMQPEDIAKAAMLAVHSSPNCTPEEITIRSPADPDI